MGCILAPFWHQFGSLGSPGDPKWASRGPGRESRGCFGGMLILGVFWTIPGNLQNFKPPGGGGYLGGGWGPVNQLQQGTGYQIQDNKVQDTKYRTGYYRIQATDW